MIACTKGPEVSDGTPKVGHRVGNLAPDFSLQSRDGSTFTLSQHRGKIVFLNFWATWCAPCRYEMPDMERMHQALKGKDFIMVAVSQDQGGWAQVDPFVKSLNLSFTVLLDQNQKVATQYRSYRLPETFIIDKQGKVIDKRVGIVKWSDPGIIAHFKGLSEKN